MKPYMYGREILFEKLLSVRRSVFTCISSFNYYINFMMLVVSIAPPYRSQNWSSLSVQNLSVVTRQISSKTRIETSLPNCKACVSSPQKDSLPLPLPAGGVLDGAGSSRLHIGCQIVSNFVRALFNTVPFFFVIVKQS